MQFLVKKYMKFSVNKICFSKYCAFIHPINSELFVWGLFTSFWRFLLCYSDAVTTQFHRSPVDSLFRLVLNWEDPPLSVWSQERILHEKVAEKCLTLYHDVPAMEAPICVFWLDYPVSSARRIHKIQSDECLLRCWNHVFLLSTEQA